MWPRWPIRPPGWPARTRPWPGSHGRSRTAAGARRPGGPTFTRPSTPPAGPGTGPARRPAVPAPERVRPEVAAALRSAERDPAGISDHEALALLDADSAE